MFRFALVICVITVLVSCRQQSNSDPDELRLQDGRFDAAEYFDGDWQKLCIAGPYTTNAMVEDIIGFGFDIQRETLIHLNDAYVVFLLVKDNQVASVYKVSRSADFSGYSGQCFSRNSGVFRIKGVSVKRVNE